MLNELAWYYHLGVNVDSILPFIFLPQNPKIFIGNISWINKVYNINWYFTCYYNILFDTSYILIIDTTENDSNFSSYDFHVRLYHFRLIWTKHDRRSLIQITIIALSGKLNSYILKSFICLIYE